MVVERKPEKNSGLDDASQSANQNMSFIFFLAILKRKKNRIVDLVFLARTLVQNGKQSLYILSCKQQQQKVLEASENQW